MPRRKTNVASKTASLLGSLRFWQLTLGAAAAAAELMGKLPKGVGSLIAGWLAAVATVGTVDKFRSPRK